MKLAKGRNRMVRMKAPGQMRAVSPKLTRARNKAIKLLSKWAKDNTAIELTSSPSGIMFRGTIGQLNLGFGDNIFLFHSLFGVTKRIFLDICDSISVDQIADSTTVWLGNEAEKPHKIGLSPAHTRILANQAEQVREQFRLWIKLKAELTILSGNKVHITIERCAPTEGQSGVFIFVGVGSKAVHGIDPAESEIITFDSHDDRTEIGLYPADLNTFVTLTDRSDSPEKILQRFTPYSGMLH